MLTERYGARISAPLCKAFAECLRNGSRLPCVRGGVKTEGFDGGVVSATSGSVYAVLLAPLIHKGSCQAFQDKEGLTEGVYPLTRYSVYTDLLPHNFPPRFRHLGEAYPFSFVTKRKAVRR